METPELVKLERIARALPCREIQLERCSGSRGEIYFGYGRDGHGKFHGVWGYLGLGMTIDFKDGATVDQVRQMLVDAAEESASQMEALFHG